MGLFTRKRRLSSYDPPILAFDNKNLTKTSDLQSDSEPPILSAAGSAHPSFSTPISPSLLSDPAFSSDPRSHPFHHHRRSSTGNIQVSRPRKADNLQPIPPDVDSSPSSFLYSSDSTFPVSLTTPSSSSNSHLSMTPATSTTPPGSPAKSSHRKSPPPYMEYDEQVFPHIEPQESIPSTEPPAEPIIRPSLIHSVTTPEIRHPTRPPQPPRPSTSITPQNNVSSSTTHQNARRPRALELDRIDELDETDPLGLPWHHKGPYETLGQPDDRALNGQPVYQPQRDALRRPKHRSPKPSSSRQAVFPDLLTLNGTVGVSLNLTPGQILPRIPIPGYGYGYSYDPQPSPHPSRKPQQSPAHYFPRHLMPPSVRSPQQDEQIHFDPPSGPSVHPQTPAREPKNLAALRELVDIQERRAARRKRRDSRVPMTDQHPTIVYEQPADTQHQPAERESPVPEDFRYSGAYGGIAEPEPDIVQQQQYLFPQRDNENAQGSPADIYHRHVRGPRILHAHQDPQNSAAIRPEQALDAHLSNRLDHRPEVPISPATAPTAHNPTAVINQSADNHRRRVQSERRNIERFNDMQMHASPDQRLGDVKSEPDRERRNPQIYTASLSDINVHQQKSARGSPSTLQRPQMSAYDTTSQRQASDRQSVQTSHASTSSIRSSGSRAQPHHLPRRLVMPTPLQLQTQPQTQQQLPQQSHGRSPSYSSPSSIDKSHPQPRAQDIHMPSGDSRKVLRKRASTSVDMKNVPLLKHASLPTNAPLPRHVPVNLAMSSRVAFAAANFGMADPMEGTRVKKDKAPKRVLSKRRNDL